MAKNIYYSMESFKTQVCGVETLFVFRRFAKPFLVITQFGKIANIFVVRPEADPCSQMGLVTDSMDVQCHFGMDTDELQVALRRVIAGSGINSWRDPLIISLALKEINKPMIDGIAEVLKMHLTKRGFIAAEGDTEENKL